MCVSRLLVISNGLSFIKLSAVMRALSELNCVLEIGSFHVSGTISPKYERQYDAPDYCADEPRLARNEAQWATAGGLNGGRHRTPIKTSAETAATAACARKVAAKIWGVQRYMV
ncbi:hypothetical protein [Bradyrhizobium elkanii]|uniref:Uncharacterized protein n=1 Tax=Bradyrhizobium elkanii TaxID=29448 RepID=A0ABV4F6E4_BRAEL|nr:hypothetical protein [Bradyrhizobium elkanii]MCP1750263.1 hypothetical protein [Bradyrhizobium elkanii]MCP1976038.1 hypothetical protein [Bradyrhizobium elkanii]MCS3889445.1 hypothetical protein [Bradyrhizobium elkanii]MCS4211534.1 hypothetical protein [Bradyrhizobium elkanii]MCW2192836.1 hypothetical protein [Bradyrhizobium elkanii]